MKRSLLVLVPACAVAAVLATQSSARQVAAAKCVKVAGVESSGQKNSLDPAIQPSSQNSLNVNLVYNRLTDRDSNFIVKPELATSWKANATATVWTFNLRKGVKFADGKPFTSADVVYTFKRVLNPKTGSEGRTTMAFLNPGGIKAVGQYAVQFRQFHWLRNEIVYVRFETAGSFFGQIGRAHV